MPSGTVQLRGVSRTYKLPIERNLTLKETILRRGRLKARLVPALREIDLDLEPGTALGVVGANGAGKSTLLKILAGIIPPDVGTVEIGGRVVSMLELGAGFHPDFTGRENVILSASINGMTRREIEGRLDAIVAFAELDRFIDAPIRTYSTGMYARLGFAVAAELEPNVLLLDEILAVDGLNPMTAARLVEPLCGWRRYRPDLAEAMKAELARIVAHPGLSKNVYELASRALA